MKTFKLLSLLIVMFLLTSCVEDDVTIILPELIGTHDFTYTIGDDAPNYLEGVHGSYPTEPDGEYTFTLTVDDSEVNLDVQGTYALYYFLEDSFGSKVTVVVDVIVVEAVVIDEVAPIIEGFEDLTFNIGGDVIDLTTGITASDNIDGDLTTSIIFTGAVDYETVGTYTVTMTVIDQAGNITVETFVVEVFNNEMPTIMGLNRIYYTLGDDTPDYLTYITAYDIEDGEILNITVIDDLVELSVEGLYPLGYQVTDSFGNVTEAYTTVEVTAVNPSTDIDSLDVYYLNDFHGSILENGEEIGFSKLSNVVNSAYNQNSDETLFLSGGDMLQGNIMSNYYYGASMIDLLNYMNLEVFVLGNHEFDWGLETILTYFDPTSDSEIKAEFPLLAANMFYEGTEMRPDFMDAYAIIEKGDIKIGVVGTIGSGLESSIARSRVDGYFFDTPSVWASYYTDILLNDFGVDMVFAINHDWDSYYNNAMSEIDGVMGVFNGHTHSDNIQTLNGVPVVQSLSNGRALGHVQYGIDASNQASVIDYENLNQSNMIALQSVDPGMDALVNGYVSELEPELNDAILVAGASYDKYQLTSYMAEIIRAVADADVGIHNTGGTRDAITYGQDITVATTYKIFPFDNQIISVLMPGYLLDSLMTNSSVRTSVKDGFDRDNIDPDAYYWVATNEYVFGGYYEFQNYEDVFYTGVVDRQAFEAALRLIAETTNTFYID